MASEVFAFSIGELQVRSQFGEKFKASFEINLDFDGPIEVGLGSVDDYTKIGLERQDIIDALILDPAQPESGSKVTVQIRSTKPLFFPSFNLVIRATHNGGTLLENFLVTVDFQQSLALNVRGKKRKPPPKELPKYEPESAVNQEKAPPQHEPQQFVTDEPVAKKEQRVNPESQTADPAASGDKAPSEESESLLTESIAPVPVKTKAMHRRRLSGVIWANPRPHSDLATGETEKTGGVQGLSTSNEVYVLQAGERLFSVARKHKVGNYHPAQIAAAIWLHNIDKFIFGNIHGIREGVQLDLKNLEEHVSGVDLQTARNILKNQAVEWKLTKSASPVEEEVSTISEIPLPSEKLEDLDDLFTQVKGWQDTWEKMDMEGHLAYYQTLESETPLLVNKKQLLARYPKPHLETFSKFMVLKEGVPVVFFTQAFSAENVKSWGLKELDWARSPSGWKIRGENFYEWFSHSGKQPLEDEAGQESRINAAKLLSFVIHVSSHPNKSSALSLTNRLRENGFDAYWAPVRMSADTFIYRVYVGRFSDWNQAHRLVRILRKKPFGGHATAIPYPLALQVGEAKSLPDARMLLESLRKSGLSGLLLVSHSEPIKTRFRVLVGAFKKAGNATWMLRQLKQSGFAAKLISP
ncbi:MAG: SPOR domain-containing protein [Nitrospinae bacterium]|nr:SPOR domain-containing protein [Nitrospinota bacterium]MBL7020578.1 SPOR domain-containing protein [Nitrospinaceae bacterium]